MRTEPRATGGAMRTGLIHLALLAVLSLSSAAGAQAPSVPELPAGEVEALIETTKGDIVIRFFPEEAPKHVAHFLETARKGGFDGTTFHRAIPYAIVQGGDPLSKDPKKKALYGTGGLKLLPDEVNAIKHYPGAVSAVALPGPDGSPQPNTSGTQFFITDTWQQSLDGKYTVFGRVTQGMDVVRAISLAPTQGDKVSERIEIEKVTVRPLTPTVEEMKRARARIITPEGEIVFEFLPETAPENARHWINLARAGYYDGASIYRAAKGFVVQGADTQAWPADSPNRKRSFSVWPVKDEFTPSVVMDRGIVGMAHGAEPNSATVHFFFLLGRATQLDNAFTAFGRVVSGMELLDKISEMPVGGETGDRLVTPVPITRVVIE